MDNGSLSHFLLPAAPTPALLRKSYSFVKGQRYAFVGYYHAVMLQKRRFGGIPLRRNIKAVLKDQVPVRRPRHTELVKRLLADKCEMCGSSEAIEVHHICKVSDLNKNGRKELPDWAKIMIMRRRKTLIVCRVCHDAIHAGKPLPKKPSK
jgi:hypothetical protein